MADQPPGHDYRVPVPPEVKKPLQDIGERIGHALPPGWGFALLIFTFNKTEGEDGTMTYISNAQRDDMLRAFQEFLQKQGS